MSITGIECAFMARVGTEPEVKISQAGKPWASFSAAVGGDKDDDQTQWVKVVVFGDKATSLVAAKGDRIYVEGRLKLDTWTGKDGKERSDLKVAAWKVERLGEIGTNKPAQADNAPTQARGNSNGDRRQSSVRDWQRPSDDGEIPFAPEVR